MNFWGVARGNGEYCNFFRWYANRKKNKFERVKDIPMVIANGHAIQWKLDAAISFFVVIVIVILKYK